MSYINGSFWVAEETLDSDGNGVETYLLDAANYGVPLDWRLDVYTHIDLRLDLNLDLHLDWGQATARPRYRPGLLTDLAW